jgi:hypothetical protein
MRYCLMNLAMATDLLGRSPVLVLFSIPRLLTARKIASRAAAYLYGCFPIQAKRPNFFAGPPLENLSSVAGCRPIAKTRVLL